MFPWSVVYWLCHGTDQIGETHRGRHSFQYQKTRGSRPHNALQLTSVTAARDQDVIKR